MFTEALIFSRKEFSVFLVINPCKLYSTPAGRAFPSDVTMLDQFQYYSILVRVAVAWNFFLNRRQPVLSSY